MMEESAQTNRGGRPKGSTTGQAKLRTLRMGALWDQAAEVATAHGYRSMTALVEEALREKLAKLDRQDRRGSDVNVTATGMRGITAAGAFAAAERNLGRHSAPPPEDVEWFTGP